MSKPKPLTTSEVAQLIATLSRRKQELKVYRYEDLSSRELDKAVGDSVASAWVIVGENNKWL
jgi:hypothetical protein